MRTSFLTLGSSHAKNPATSDSRPEVNGQKWAEMSSIKTCAMVAAHLGKHPAAPNRFPRAAKRKTQASPIPPRSAARPSVRRTKSMSSEGEPRLATRCAYQRARGNRRTKSMSSEGEPRLATRPAWNRARGVLRRRHEFRGRAPTCYTMCLETSPGKPAAKPRVPRASPDLLHAQTHQRARGPRSAQRPLVWRTKSKSSEGEPRLAPRPNPPTSPGDLRYR